MDRAPVGIYDNIITAFASERWIKSKKRKMAHLMHLDGFLYTHTHSPVIWMTKAVYLIKITVQTVIL